MKLNQKNVVRLILIAIVVFGIFVALNPKTVQAGDTVSVDYVVQDQRGIVVDTSLEHIAKESSIYTPSKTYTPLTFKLGANQVIEGFDNAVGDNHLHTGVGHGKMFDFTQAKFHIIQSGGFSERFSVSSCLGDHVRGHVYANGPSGGADLLSR